MNDRSRYARYFLLTALALVFWKCLIGLAPSGRDLVLQYLPYQELVRESVRGGSAPYWNPMTFCGRPLMADIQVGVLYPPNWLHLILPLPLSFTILLLGHAGLALWGAYRLGRVWGLAEPAAAWMAILYTFSGFLTLKLQQGVVLFLYVAAWAPWACVVLMALLRIPSLSRAIGLGLILALSLLAGSPQMTFFIWLLVLGLAALMIALKPRHGDWGVGRIKAGGLVVFAFALALALTTVQTFQTKEMIAVSFDRGELGAQADPAKKHAYFTEGSLNPWLLLLQLNPGFFGPGHDDLNYSGGGLGFSEACAYMPVAAWWLLIPIGKLLSLRRKKSQGPGEPPLSDAEREAARLRTALLWAGIALALFGLLMAPGARSFVFEFFYRFVPGFGMFRVPARYLFFFNTGVAVASSVALHEWLTADPRGREKAMRAVGMWIIGGTLLGALAVGFSAFGLERTLRAFTLTGLAEFTAGEPGGAPRPERLASAMAKAVGGVLYLSIAGGALALIGRVRSLPTETSEVDFFPEDPTTDKGPARLDRNRRAALALAWSLPALAALELAMLSWQNQPSTPIGRFRAEHYPTTPLVEAMKGIHAKAPEGGRLLWTDTLLDWRRDEFSDEVITNALIMQGLPDARGYDPVNARWIGTWFNRLAGLPPEMNPRGYMYVPTIAEPGLLGIMGVKTVLTYEDLSDFPSLAQVGEMRFQSGALRVYLNRGYEGMAWLAPLPPTTPPAVTRDEAQEITIQRIAASPETPPTRQVVFDEQIVSLPIPPGWTTTRFPEKFQITPIEERFNRYAYTVKTSSPAALCLAMSAYPGWSVKVDGAYAPISTVSGTFLGTAVPAGEHVVEFEYAPPPGYEYARLLSLAAAAFVIFILGKTAWRARRRRISA